MHGCSGLITLDLALLSKVKDVRVGETITVLRRGGGAWQLAKGTGGILGTGRSCFGGWRVGVSVGGTSQTGGRSSHRGCSDCPLGRGGEIGGLGLVIG